MRGIYLASCLARHPGYDIVYQDIDPYYNCDIGGDMLSVDLSNYDFVIASPPCNFWSRANYRYLTSSYSLSTKHLLPSILIKLSELKKPFIVENVCNSVRFKKYGIYDIADKYNLNVYIVGRHTYFTNISINLECSQVIDYVSNKCSTRTKDFSKYRQGGINVHNVIEIWLDAVVNNHYVNPCQTNIFDFL